MIAFILLALCLSLSGCGSDRAIQSPSDDRLRCNELGGTYVTAIDPGHVCVLELKMPREETIP